MAGSYELVYRVSRGRKEPDDTNVRINVSPPSCRDNWPLSWFIDFFFPSFLENYIYKYFKRREKRGEGEEEGGMFRELEKSLSHKLINIFSDTIGCVSRLCANVVLPRILASRL